MTLVEALAIYVLVKEQSGTHDEAQRLAYLRAMEMIYDGAVAAIEEDWTQRS